MRDNISDEVKQELDSIIKLSNKELEEFKSLKDVKISVGYNITDLKDIIISVKSGLYHMYKMYISYHLLGHYNFDVSYFNEKKLSKSFMSYDEICLFIKHFLNKSVNEVCKYSSTLIQLDDSLKEITDKCVKDYSEDAKLLKANKTAS